MSQQPNRELLRRLALAPGVPGAERAVRRIVRETVEEVGEISYDALGSLICEVGGKTKSPRVLVDAHMDEVGFMVQSITDEGRLRFVPLGGWWGHVLLAQRVQVLTDSGTIAGVIGSTPPHFLKGKERDQVLGLEKMYVDVGASSRRQVEDLGIRVGDAIAPHSEWVEFGVNGVLSCKAFDDRVGVGLLCELLRSLSATDHPNTVVGVAAVQEEVGCRGAATACEVASADVGIVLEGTPADDLPGFTERQSVLGGGPQIRLYDPTALSNRRLVRFVERTAEAHGIAVQTAVRRSGGTDARSIHMHGRGVPTVVIAVPARHIHTHVSLIQWEDYVNAYELLGHVVRGLDEESVRSFTDYAEADS